MSRIGIITGSRIEARCLGSTSFAVVGTGANADRARAEAERLIQGGAKALVSFGLAGGLSPELAAGALLLPEVVLGPDGIPYRVDARWREALQSRMAAAGLACRGGLLACSDRLVATPGAKRKLFERTGALAVDMESQGVAAVARARRVPLLVLRAIADPADQEVPQAALAALGPDGRTRILSLLAALARRPRDVPLLVRLARTSQPGLETLRAAVAAAGPDLALPPVEPVKETARAAGTDSARGAAPRPRAASAKKR